MESKVIGYTQNSRMSVNDPLNLRDYIRMITEFIRSIGAAPEEVGELPTTAYTFLDYVLNGVFSEKDQDEKSVNSKMSPREEKTVILWKLQKLLSANASLASVQKYVLRITSGGMKETIVRNLGELVQKLLSGPKAPAFFDELNKNVSPRFFTREEAETLECKLQAKQYDEFLYDLLIHGFLTLHNLPAVFAERMYEEAMTYFYDHPVRYELLRLAAENGCEKAAVEYGNYLSKMGSNAAEAYRYLMMGMPTSAAMWNLAYLVETHRLEPAYVKEFGALVDAKIKKAREQGAEFEAPEFTEISFNAPNADRFNEMKTAYRAYYYLAKVERFFKAYNSMGKLLEKTASFSEGASVDKNELMDQYFKTAVSGSCLLALNNYGCKISNQLSEAEKNSAGAGNKAPGVDPEDRYTRILVLESLGTAAQMGSCNASYRLAEYYRQRNAMENEELKKLYQRAVELDTDRIGVAGKALRALGNLETDPGLKREYYERALKEGDADSAYYLGEIYYDLAHVNKDRRYIWALTNKITENMDQMSEQVKNRAEELLVRVDEEKDEEKMEPNITPRYIRKEELRAPGRIKLKGRERPSMQQIEEEDKMRLSLELLSKAMKALEELQGQNGKPDLLVKHGDAQIMIEAKKAAQSGIRPSKDSLLKSNRQNSFFSSQKFSKNFK